MPRAHRSLLLFALCACCQREPVVNRLPQDSAVHDAARDGALRGDVGLDLSLDCPGPQLGDAGDAPASATGWQLAQIAAVPLHDVACVKGHVFVAGDKGTLLHRAPKTAACGGFVPQRVGTSSDLLTVSFADLSRGVTAGRDAKIWETRDAGKSWLEAAQCGAVKFSAFHALHLYAADKGCAVGDVASPAGASYKIYSGINWVCPMQGLEGQTLYGVFRFQDRCWFVGDTQGRIYHLRSEDSAWYTSVLKSAKPLRGVFALDATHAVSVGDEGTILRTEDGVSWSEVSTLGTDTLYDLFFADALHGWAVGENGTILASTDGGKSWSYQLAPTSERLAAVCFSSAKEGWVVGEKGSILHTKTGGS